MPYLDTDNILLSSLSGKRALPITLVSEKTLGVWLKKQPPAVKSVIDHVGFRASPGNLHVLYDNAGKPTTILAGISSPASAYDSASIAEGLAKSLAPAFIKDHVFAFNPAPGKTEDANALALGWVLAHHRFDRYKKDISSARPKLLWPKGADKERVKSMAEAMTLIRVLVNTPANDLGPAELEFFARDLAKRHKATFKSIAGNDLLKFNYPMIHAVGKGASLSRAPRLIDLKWGNEKHPKLTLVGKGVCFDTGGLDIKPSAMMYLMKKDMGGAAHSLALAHLIISLKLPVRLRVLIPAVENMISAESYRPSDVLKSRAGLSVEVSDTDAEGRLVLADALALASEEKPDLMIDFATLTGSARVALGYDLPATFSRPENLAESLKTLGQACGDPVWPLPLWQPYRKEMRSDIADTASIGSGKAGAIHAALFLENFVAPEIDWVHMDIYSWEQNGKPGRPRGGADTGLLAAFALIEKRYARKRRK